MLKHVAVATAVALMGWSSSQAGGHAGNCCPCPCGTGVAAATQAPDAVPPAAPQQGTTAQSRSIEPQTSPPAAPTAGVTTRSYSYQPAPVYQPATSYQSAPRGLEVRGPYDPGRRLRPSTRMYYTHSY